MITQVVGHIQYSYVEASKIRRNKVASHKLWAMLYKLWDISVIVNYIPAPTVIVVVGVSVVIIVVVGVSGC